MPDPSPMNRNFKYMRQSMTGREALRKFPRPAFFMRPSASQSLDEVRAVLIRNADEAERLAVMLRSWTRFEKKAPIMDAANKLHDFRVSLDITSGEAGRPYLWEE
jgi:hypothetical protein